MRLRATYEQQVYEYRFTTPEERKATGEWWHRERKGIYVLGVVPLTDHRKG
jgi:hypothetical protein